MSKRGVPCPLCAETFATSWDMDQHRRFEHVRRETKPPAPTVPVDEETRERAKSNLEMSNEFWQHAAERARARRHRHVSVPW